MSAYLDKVIADGATHYWRLGQPSGAFTDLVGTAHGALTGGTTMGRAVPGALTDGDKAASFAYDQGNGGYVGCGSLTLPVPGSLEAWVKTPAAAGATKIFWTNRDGTVTTNALMGVNGAGVPEFGSAAGTAIGVSGTQAVDNGQWHHLVGTNDGTTLNIWVDGVLGTPRTGGTLGATTGPGAIGWDNFVGVADGVSVDEVALYPTVLTPTQVSAHYTLGTTVAGPSLPRDLNTGLYTYLLGVFGLSGGTSYVDRVRADGATNHWRLGETSGTTAVDAIGGANGTISGGVTLNQPSAMADGNAAMYFDAANDYVRVASGYYAIGTGAFTIECWLNSAAAFPATAPFIIETSGGANGAGFAIMRPGTSLLSFKISSGTTAVYAQVNYPWDGQWHHVVGTLTRGAPDLLSVYVDGVLAGTTNPAANGWNLTTANALLMSTYSGGEASPDFRYTGAIDDVSIYPRALTANEIAAHYSLGRSAMSGGNDLTTLITRYLATLTGDMTARWKTMEKNAGF